MVSHHCLSCPAPTAARPALGSLNHFGHNQEIALGAPTAFALRPATNDAHLDVLRRNGVLRSFLDEAARFQLHRARDPIRAEIQKLAGSNSPGVANAVTGLPMAARDGHKRPE